MSQSTNLLHVSRFFTLVLLLIALVACASPSAPPTSVPATLAPTTAAIAPTAIPPIAAPSATTAPVPATITMWTWMNPEANTPREVAFKQILTNFKRDYPYITVQIQSVPWQEIGTKWRAAVETGAAPDLIWLLKSVPDRAKFYENLDPMVLAKMAKEDLGDITTINTDESRVGTTSNLAFPVWPSAGSVLYYRKDLFAKAGIQAPLRTWDDFKKAAKALTLDTNADGKIDVWGFGDSYGEKAATTTSFFFALADLQPSFYDLSTKKCLMASDQAVQSAQLIVDLVNDGVMPKDSLSNDYETLLEQFYRGRFAIIQSGSHRYGSILQNVGFGKENLGEMPWPTWKGDRVGPAFMGGGWEIGITKGTKNPEASGALLRYLMSKDSSTLWMQVGGQVPNRKSLLNDPYLQKPENGFLSLPARIIAEHPYFPEPIGINTGETPGAFDDALQKMMLAGKVDKGLLQAACDRVDRAQQK